VHRVQYGLGGAPTMDSVWRVETWEPASDSFPRTVPVAFRPRSTFDGS